MKVNPEYSSRFRILKGGKISLVVSALLGSVTLSFAAPSGGIVTSGSATINQSGKVTNINQSTQKASINWQKFSVASDETVNFNQPNVNSITLNRVVGNERSVINGALNANGQVWILNSNGILFGKNASINTAGLLATTKELSNQDFNTGNYNFKGSSTESVINLGEIDISNSGYAILLANSVSNERTIKAVKGSVRLIGANEVMINLNGNSILDLTVNKGVLDALVENKGAIYADGGQVYLTTNAVDELLKGVVNNTGIIEANSLDGVTGYVELFAHGGEVQVGGTITAKDGFVETSGKDFIVDKNTNIKAKTWLIDPLNLTVDDATAYETALGNGTNTLIQTDNATGSDEGNIYINDTIDWTTTAKLTLDAYNNIYINKAISATAGQLALHYGDAGDYYVNAQVNLSAGDNFFTKKASDGAETTWTVVTTANALESMSLSGNTVLGADVDASGIVNWTPIGDNSNSFTGNFDGLGHTISDLYINSSSNYIGLFGYTNGATIKNIGLVNFSVAGNSTNTGGLVGYAKNSTIKNSYTSGTISGGAWLGGLVGYAKNSIIENSYTSGIISGINFLGGLVGYSDSSTIKNSYSTGSVSSGNNFGNLGGLVGWNYNSIIENSYYDNEANTETMGDTSLGKTKAEIMSLASTFWDNNIWRISGSGAEVEGYEVEVKLPYLVGITRNEDRDSTILFESGYGTESSAYTIKNWTQLQNINNSNILTQNYYFKLLNDLLTNTEGYTTQVKDGSTLANGGVGWNPLGNSTTKFAGTFDGDGHVIDSLILDRSYTNIDSYLFLGLFGYTDNGSIIQNIGVTNVDVKGAVTVNVSGTSTFSNLFVGSLAGYNKGIISNAYTTGKVFGKVDSSNVYTGINYSGGLVGANTGIIENSYTTTDVEVETLQIAKNYSGGLVGSNFGTIENSYASNTLTVAASSDSSVGGLVGSSSSFSGATTNNSYYDKTKNTGIMSDSSLGKSTTDLKNLATFSDWDIESYTSNENTFPTLSWQYDASKGYTKKWVIGQKESSGGGTTPIPTPTPNEVEKVVTAIVNQNVLTINPPRVKTPNSLGQNVAVNFNAGGNQALISQPIEGQNTQRISLSEARQMQQENGVNSQEVRVPLSRSSMIELVDGGVNLPLGIEQEFYVAQEL